jgi:hypothetical protein
MPAPAPPKPKKTAAELTALLMTEIRKHPESLVSG